MFLMLPTNRKQKEKFHSGISIGFTKPVIKFCTFLANPLVVVVVAIVNNQKSRLILVNMEVLHWRV